MTPDQPKPVTGQHGSDGMPPLRGPSKPTGEWTVYSVMKLRQKHWHEEDKNNAIAIAHNAELAAEREKGRGMTEEQWRKLDKDFVKQLIGSRMTCELCRQIIATDDYQWHMETHHSEKQKLIDADLECSRLRQQLAAEREKVQTLVNLLKAVNLMALEGIKSQRFTFQQSLERIQGFVDANLAKVKP
jgi:hypothetical protein